MALGISLAKKLALAGMTFAAAGAFADGHDGSANEGGGLSVSDIRDWKPFRFGMTPERAEALTKILADAGVEEIAQTLSRKKILEVTDVFCIEAANFPRPGVPPIKTEPSCSATDPTTGARVSFGKNSRALRGLLMAAGGKFDSGIADAFAVRASRITCTEGESCDVVFRSGSAR